MNHSIGNCNVLLKHVYQETWNVINCQKKKLIVSNTKEFHNVLIEFSPPTGEKKKRQTQWKKDIKKENNCNPHYLSSWEFFQKAISFVGYTKFKIRCDFNLNTGILGRNKRFVCAKIIRICVQSLKIKKFTKPILKLNSKFVKLAIYAKISEN